MSAGLHLRKKFAIGSLLVATPAMIYLLRHHGASWMWALGIFASLVPAFLAALSDSILELAPKLHQDIVPLQRNQIAAAIARLCLTVISIIGLPFAAAGILAAGISRAWANIRLRKIAERHVTWQGQPSREIETEILRVVKRMLPTSVYYCVSGQLTIWLLSIMGSTAAVGQIGALNGLSTMLNIFTVIFTTLIVPRFARLPHLKGTIIARFLVLQ
jgi:O-antigen/teichoic acid export membrane protein